MRLDEFNEKYHLLIKEASQIDFHNDEEITLEEYKQSFYEVFS